VLVFHVNLPKIFLGCTVLGSTGVRLELSLEQKMGHWEGHSSTGAFWFTLGLFFVLQGLNCKRLRSLKEDPVFISFEGFAMLFGGIVYGLGEVLLIGEGGWLPSTTSHLIMSSLFIIGGGVTLLHIHRFVKGSFFSLVNAIIWIIVGVMWHGHPQESQFATFAHVNVGSLFFALAAVKVIEQLVAHYTNPDHHEKAHHDQDIYDNVHSHEPCSEKCPILPTSILLRVTNAQVHSAYTNPIIYETPFPLLKGILLLWIGSFVFNLALHFNYYTNAELRTFPPHEAMHQFLIHLLVIIVGTTAIAIAASCSNKSEDASKETQIRFAD